jgi:hypothetical protein
MYTLAKEKEKKGRKEAFTLHLGLYLFPLFSLSKDTLKASLSWLHSSQFPSSLPKDCCILQLTRQVKDPK